MYAYTQDVPIDAGFYRTISDGLGDTPPAGLIVHLAIDCRGEGCATSTSGKPRRTANDSVRSGSILLSTDCSPRCSATNSHRNPHA